jgi:hypothetical protein
MSEINNIQDCKNSEFFNTSENTIILSRFETAPYLFRRERLVAIYHLSNNKKQFHFPSTAFEIEFLTEITNIGIKICANKNKQRLRKIRRYKNKR